MAVLGSKWVRKRTGTKMTVRGTLRSSYMQSKKTMEVNPKHSIMSELKKSQNSDKILVSKFDAFRFPSSDMVQFRAMVTPCMPTCPPVTCDVLDYTGQNRQVESYGRKKRWLEPINRVKRSSEPDEVLVVQSLRIVDKSQK